MPSLSAQQNLSQGDSWRDYALALQAYQAARSQDPAFDNVTALHWIIDAAQTAKNYYLAAINAAYDDADAAFARLQSVTKAAQSYVTSLTNETASWNKFADVASAVEGLAVALEPPFDPLKILTAAGQVPKAIG
jgi:aspartate ammonia-lyase